MKYLISLLLCLNAQAMITIEHQNNVEAAIKVHDILTDQYDVPTTLIDIKSGGCEILGTKKIAHLCITSTGELIIKNFNKLMIKESLSVFKN